MSTCLAHLVERLKLKKAGHGGEGSQVQVPNEIFYYLVTKCLVIKKNLNYLPKYLNYGAFGRAYLYLN